MTKVAANIVQDLSEAEQAQARANISAASASDLTSLASTVENNTYEISGINSKLGSMEWTKVNLDTTVIGLANSVELFRVGNLIIGYFFQSGDASILAKTFRIAVKSASGRRYVWLNSLQSNQEFNMMSETDWGEIGIGTGGTRKYKFMPTYGYDGTADRGIHFEVQYLSSSDGTSPLVCRYRILEE
jgi:hypothetical protein